MRYFKYNNTNKTDKESYKAELAVFDEHGKRLARKDKFWGVLIGAVSTSAGIAAFILLGVFISLVDFPESDILFVNVLHTVEELVYRIIVGLISLVLAFILGALVSIPFDKMRAKTANELKTLRREHIRELSQKATVHLAEFYGLQEPYMVTKCYACTDTKFKNKDICIFICDGEIRITRTLYNVLEINERNIGCYAFEPSEFSLCYGEYKGKKAAELTAGETKFTLAARAKPFIEKLLKNGENFIKNKKKDIKNKKKDIFLPMARKKKGSSAYYEFSYCKKNLPLSVLVENGYTIWQEDALLVHIDDDAELFKYYLCYLSPTHAPDGTDKFFYAGVNYYTKAEAAAILQRLKNEKPPYSEQLIAWLENGKEYNGFFFLGI